MESASATAGATGAAAAAAWYSVRQINVVPQDNTLYFLVVNCRNRRLWAAPVPANLWQNLARQVQSRKPDGVTITVVNQCKVGFAYIGPTHLNQERLRAALVATDPHASQLQLLFDDRGKFLSEALVGAEDINYAAIAAQIGPPPPLPE
jgi:hypothetical protein